MNDRITQNSVGTVKHCPGCGSTNIDQGPNLERPDSEERVFDVYCQDCKWSGDVSPDEVIS